MRTAVALLLAVLPAVAADGLGRTLRSLRADDRDRRIEALEALAEGRIRPESKSETRRTARILQRFLSRRFGGKERALAVRALGSLGSNQLEEILDWMEEERDDRVVAAAARVFRAAPAEMASDLAVRIGGAEDPLARAVLVRLLAGMRQDEALEYLRVRARVPGHWCPRAAAIHGLARDRKPETTRLLMELLDEEDPALRTAVVESLQSITGKRFGRDPVEWRAWWRAREEMGERGLPEPGELAEPERRRYAHETRDEGTIRPYFFGIPVRGSDVVIVFDVSASMRYKLPLAYDQLVRCVKGLPSTSRFDVVFFNEFVWPWRGRLSSADPVTKELLVRHLPTIEIKSYTNLFDSLEKALSMDPDEIFVISDGEPNRGKRQDPRGIIRGIEKLNVRRVPIHTVSVVRTVDGDEHVALLREIAERTGGESVERTLK